MIFKLFVSLFNFFFTVFVLLFFTFTVFVLLFNFFSIRLSVYKKLMYFFCIFIT